MTRLFEQVGGVANELAKLIGIEGERAEEIIEQLGFANYLSLINAIRTADEIEAKKIIDQLGISTEAATATNPGKPTKHAAELPPNVGQGFGPVIKAEPELDEPPQMPPKANPFDSKRQDNDQEQKESATSGATSAGGIAIATAPLSHGVPHRRRKKKDD